MYLDPKHWTPEFYPQPEFDREGFQARLDKICGKVREHSKIRIVWGASEEEKVAEQISGLGTGLGYKMQGRFLTRVPGKTEKVRIRRFVFEEWQPPEISSLEDRFITMPGSAGLVRPATFDDHQGSWELIYVVADHSQCRKDVCDSLEFPCHGEYRKPDENDLNKFMRITGAIQDSAIQIDPFSPMSQEIMERLSKRTAETVAARSQAIEAEEDAYFEDRKQTRKKLSFSN